MRACQLDDSPKLSFHLHRLDEAGLVRHTGELYRLTPKGLEAAEALERLEQEAAASSEQGFIFRRDTEPPAQPAPRPATRRTPARRSGKSPPTPARPKRS